MPACPRFARRPRRARRSARFASSFALGAALVVAAAGCGSKSTGATSSAAPTSTSAPRPATDATLQIVSPGPNARTGPHVRVTMRLDGAHLAPATQTGGAIQPDEGHIHLSLDGQLIAMPLRLVEPLPRLRAGAHTVQAEFVATDHLPFDNRVVAAVTFNVR